MNAPPPGVVLLCDSCQHVWEPTTEDWATGHTTCPDCGGWTMAATLDEPKPTDTPPHRQPTVRMSALLCTKPLPS